MSNLGGNAGGKLAQDSWGSNKRDYKKFGVNDDNEDGHHHEEDKFDVQPPVPNPGPA